MKFHRDLLQRKSRAVDYTKYLTIKLLKTSGTIKWTGSSQIEYNIVGDNKWLPLNQNETITSTLNNSPLQNGTIISFRGNCKNISGSVGSFVVNTDFDLIGNCMAILGTDSFNGLLCTFSSMFAGQNVISISENFLPTENLTANVYNGMFKGCTKLLNTPKLIVKCDENSCYEMFKDCSSLTNANVTIKEINNGKPYSCYSMFENCYALHGGVSITATTTEQSCYEKMFKGCESLINLPDIPANVLKDKCCYEMFSAQSVSYNYWHEIVINHGCKAPNRFPIIGNNRPLNIGISACELMFAGFAHEISLDCPSISINTIYDYGCKSMFFGSGIKNDNNIINVVIPYTASHSYESMFEACKNLKYSPIHTLPGNIVNYAYSALFKNCEMLCNHPSLTIESPAPYSCDSMFSGCISLIDAHNIIIANTNDYCCIRMFENSGITTNDSLNGMPVIVADTTHSYCYASMFSECNNITYVPDGYLPATSITRYCYNGMFHTCKSLKTIPHNLLPAVDLTDYSDDDYSILGGGCYMAMFYGCASLEEIPEDPTKQNKSFLPATTLTRSCYESMFAYCSNLVRTTTYLLPATKLKDSCYAGMFRSCKSLKDNSEGHSVPELKQNISLVYECYSDMFRDCINFNPTTDNEERLSYLPKPESLAEYCYSGMFSNSGITKFPYLENTKLGRYCYEYMFSDCQSLPETIPADIFPANCQLNEGCYAYMFSGSNVKNLVKLPYTSLKNECYKGMFSECKHIETIPTDFLPATTLVRGCYTSLFSNSNINDNLIVTVSESLKNVTTLSHSCYESMFKECTNITTIPDNMLKLTELISGCYRSMFYGCTSLTTAPKLPAPTLAPYCYEGMFSGCTSLTTAPVLEAQVLKGNCYHQMFENCTSLNVVNVKFNAIDEEEPSSGCCDSMFYGCNKLTDVSNIKLNATKLSVRCYANMFRGCSSLTTTPELPATTLASYCYESMFYGCTQITSTTTNPIVLPATNLVSGCYEKMFGNIRSNNPICIKALFVDSPYDKQYNMYRFTSEWMAYISNNSNNVFIASNNADWVHDRTNNSGLSNGTGIVDYKGAHSIPNKWQVLNEDGQRLY